MVVDLDSSIKSICLSIAEFRNLNLGDNRKLQILIYYNTYIKLRKNR